MARAIWSGSISFGMVSIPVKLYGATESKDIRFHLLHAKDGTRLKQVRWCPTDEAEVPWSETARGYEYTKGQYVVLTDQDFENLPLPSKHSIDISAFVEEAEIDPVYFEKSYIVAPQRDAEKPYALLLSAMERSGRVGMAGSCFGRSLIWSRSARRTARWPSRRCSSATRFVRQSDWSATSAQPGSPSESSNSHRS